MSARTSLVLSAIALSVAGLASGCASEASEPSTVPTALGDDVDETAGAGGPDEDTVDVGEGDVPEGRKIDVGTLETSGARTGDTIVSGDVSVIVPEKGETIGLTAELEDGSSTTLEITHRDDDTVIVAKAGTARASTAASPSACQDGAFNAAAYTWTKPYAWSFRSGTTPETNSKSNVETSLKEAAGNITGARNDCGLVSKLTASQEYLGRTTRSTNIVSGATSIKCGARDGKNVVGFGVLPKGTLGIACVWYAGAEALEGDIKLNDRGYRWFARNKATAACRTAYSVEGVATHEMGHVFGLMHVSESGHGNLTMSTRARSCTNADASLGKGDVLALRSKYGS